MNYQHSHKLRPKALASLGLPCLLAFTLLLLLLLLSPGLPKSFAARATKASRTNSAQEAPAISISSPYRQTNLVSDLPGVAFLEDSLLVDPWGVTLTSSGPFWVVDNGKDSVTLYAGDVGFNFWLNKLNSFNGDFHKADMVKAFLRSTEYRRRFGPP